MSRLLALSPEIRNVIWRYALLDPTPFKISSLRYRKAQALTQTCRTIRNETRLMFYSINTFRIELRISTRSHDMVYAHLVKLGPRVCSHMDLTASIGSLDNLDLVPGDECLLKTWVSLMRLAERIAQHPSTKKMKRMRFINAVSTCRIHVYIPVKEFGPPVKESQYPRIFWRGMDKTFSPRMVEHSQSALGLCQWVRQIVGDTSALDMLVLSMIWAGSCGIIMNIDGWAGWAAALGWSMLGVAIKDY